MNKIEEIKKKVIIILDKYLDNNYTLILFGSFAKNKIDKISDIDLAVFSKEIIPSSVIAQAKEELENKVITLRNIDLINLTDRNINDKLLENILKESVIWKTEKNSKEPLKNLKKHLRSLRK
jgi:predicted nucleotidyltransferase